MRRKHIILLLPVVGFLFLAGAGWGSSPDLVVDTQFVMNKMEKADWVILDTRTPEEYKDAHIQGAISLGKRADKAMRDPTHRSYPIVPAIEKTLGTAGIGNDKHIILYGKAADAYYTTVPFWVLEYLGCNSPALKCTVHYYDGGIERWEAEGGRIEQKDSVLPPAQFKANVVPSRLATTEEVMEAVKGKKKAVIIDARTEAEYSGAEIRALRGGHIPGAVNIKVQKNYTGDTFRMIPLSEAMSLYRDIQRAERVIVHCQTGTRSTYTYLVLRLLGYENVSNYDDSWIVWGNNVVCPVESEQWYDLFEVSRSMKELKEMQHK